MDDKIIEKNEEVEIDLQRVFRAVWQKAWLVVAVSVLCAVIAFVGSFFLITPRYSATAMFYVNNNAFSAGEASLSISSGDLVTSRSLVESYLVILNTRQTLNDVIDYAGVDRSYAELKEMLSAAAVNETEIFEVCVTSPDPLEAERIADAITYILPKRIATIIDGTSAKVVDAAVVPSTPSSPSYSKNSLVGFLFGFVLMVGIIALREVFDITIREKADVIQACKHPILAVVPDMTVPGKGGAYYYGYGNKGKQKKDGRCSQGKQTAKETALIGSNISFAASEAYKLLRTKLQFAFADENDCHVIGLSSALNGEGKSLTAVNLAYTLSELDKKVILIDCDMRWSALAKKLGVRKKPGLSNYLTGQSHLDELIQQYHENDKKAFDVISAGQNPPNPIELLSSARMTGVLDQLRDAYDYVILDLPPVGEVSDAMAVAKATDGMLLVVRRNYCNRVALSEASCQFDFINAKILGVVFNCTSEYSGNHGKCYHKKCCKRGEF